MRNIAKCAKCGVIIESTYRHHFVSCRCGAISLDGGVDYRRALAKDFADVLELTPEEIEAWDQTPTGRLEEWYWTADNAWGAPMLYGYVYDDKLQRFADGTFIRTSRINNGQDIVEGALVKTRNSAYLLGKKRKEKAA